jgi:hypothetical protein
MKSIRTLIAALVLLAALFALRAEAAPTMAFGYLVNRSGDMNYEYLETIFPNSFASSIRNIFRVSVIKPGQADAILAKNNGRLEKKYLPYELLDLTDRLSADFFIYGYFTLLPGERIKINLSLYSRGSNRIFSFTNTGKMETEIFKLVDRITAVMIDFLGNNNFFISRTIPRGSKIGIFTNLDGAELNYLYSAFMNGGFRVASIQANSLYNDLSGPIIENFKTVSAAENSFEGVSDPRSVRFLHGTWTGARYYEEITYKRETYRIFDVNYMENKFNALEKLAGHHGIDTVMFIGFNGTRTSAWVRCLDLKSRELIWMQSNISGSLPGICDAMLRRMTADIVSK